MRTFALLAAFIFGAVIAGPVQPAGAATLRLAVTALPIQVTPRPFILKTR